MTRATQVIFEYRKFITNREVHWRGRMLYPGPKHGYQKYGTIVYKLTNKNRISFEA